jgi:methylated-DNA-protein-cysteine methyltransferase-like protein
MAHCPPGVPWHRVINAQGKVSRRARGDGHRRQQGLLEAEGVVFDALGRVDFAVFGWPKRQR